jgi:hypothetical protein
MVRWIGFREGAQWSCRSLQIESLGGKDGYTLLNALSRLRIATFTRCGRGNWRVPVMCWEADASSLCSPELRSTPATFIRVSHAFVIRIGANN